MHDRTLTELAADLAAKHVSAVELTKHFLARIERYDDALNAFVTVTAEQALTQAKAADERRARGDAAPLTGIPLAHKDIFCTAGVKTSCGSKMLDNFVAPYDATVVERFADAGAVMLGKTNMDEFAMGSSNETSYYGPVHNPWDRALVPGGSSGGSAAAVAARIAPAATGTDTGGSIRQPAALSGITGIKPTYGRVSRYGMIAFASSLDQAGVLTQTAADAALLLEAIAGLDERDSTSRSTSPCRTTRKIIDEPWERVTIGVPESFFDAGLDPEVASTIRAALEGVREARREAQEREARLHPSLGARVLRRRAGRGVLEPVALRRRALRPSLRATPSREDLETFYMRNRGEGFGAEVKRRIMTGTYVLSAGYFDAYYLQAQKVRKLISDDFARAFREVDLVAGPTSPSPAFGIGEKTERPDRDVPERHLHDRREPRGPARDVAAVRLRRAACPSACS